MVNPVTGPIVKSIDYGWYHEYSTGWRQRRPYTVKLPYNAERGAALAFANHADGWRYSATAYGLLNQPSLYAQAYGKVVEQLGQNAGLGISLTQWRQADQMIGKRGNQLLSFTKQLARRSPVGVATSLGISARQASKILGARYGTARKLSDLWLEFWFGWKPMVEDIYTACEVFDDYIPWAYLKGMASGLVTHQILPGTPWSEGWIIGGRAKCKVGIEVRLVNPNVRLLNQLGLLNPAAIAWDAVPWSFVVDWFANVSSWLNSFTDFAGFETSAGYISRNAVCGGRTYWPAYPEKGGPGIGIASSRVLVYSLPRPSLALKGLSLKPARALTAISLLTQKLPHH